MKTLETNHGNDWRDKILNSWPFLLDTDDLHSAFAIAYCKQAGEWVVRGGNDDRMLDSLFYNGTFFARYIVTTLTAPILLGSLLLGFFLSDWFFLGLFYGFCFHISWRETGNRRYMQFGLGHKLNGRLGLIFRIPKNDEQSSKGAHDNAPNSGQATGWNCGPK